jgi:hypothetical protein
MKLLGVLGFLLCFPACHREDGARVAVRNRSNTPLEGLHLFGRCFDEDVGTLAPGRVAEVRVKPCGESGIQTRFTANGAARVTPEVGYIEASAFYDEKLAIGADYQASLDR